MKLIDLLVQELPKRGGWPFKTSDILALRPFMFKHKLEFTATAGGQWFHQGAYCSVSFETYKDALAASKQAEWDGEGLPPVGLECEWLAIGDHDWMKVKVLAYHEDEVWLQPLNGAQSFTVGNPDDFRPIRSEAERKREEAGLAIYHAINWNAEGELASPSRMEDYRKAYDAIAAGEIPGVKLI